MEKKIDLKEILDEVGVRMSRLMHYGGEVVFPETGADKWALVRADCVDAALDVVSAFEGWLRLCFETDDDGCATGVVVLKSCAGAFVASSEGMEKADEARFERVATDIRRLISLKIERTLLQGRYKYRENELQGGEEALVHSLLSMLL
ncbi:MAG: hypothetical protein J6C81_08795 [Muribaculaceae bacterium]|nr:hypothetical protein [Muribaculaceae bacterium]